MRRTRLLILAFLLAIVAIVGVTYKFQRGLAARNAPPPPPRLPEKVSAKASRWNWRQDVGSTTKVEVTANDFQQIAEPARFELRGVELRIYDKTDQSKFDKITSAKADFDLAQQVLFSEGEVEIAVGLKLDAQGKELPAEKLLMIKSSGVRFESKTGRVLTDRAAQFTFDRSEGQSTGATYDSISRELRMDSNVVLRYKGANPEAKPMEVSTGNLVYKEAESKVYLSPWAKLTRATFNLQGTDAVVTLVDGAIQLVETQKASGGDASPGRALAYSADNLAIHFNAENEVEKVAGSGNARLVSTTAAGETIVTTKRVDLEFDTPEPGSQLKKARATGDSVVESRPSLKPNQAPPDTRILRSDVIELAMLPGGREIDTVQTHTPGTIDFIPNRRGQRKRNITGERMWITYGADNRIKSYRAVNVTTRSEREPPKDKPPLPPALTWSHDFQAEFDPATGQLARMEQWGDFRYEEGDRRARAEKAVLEQAKEEITLLGKARTWDPSGSTDADRIVLNQQSGNFEATGNVASTRVQEQKEPKEPKPPVEPQKQGASPMFSGPDPVQAKAEKMTTSERNDRIRYEGNAILWQGPNRITADAIEIDRKNQRLEARGNVFTQMVDKRSEHKPAVEARPGEKPPAAKPAGQVFTTVRAPELVYSDKERLAWYKGGVVLNRPSLTLNSTELRAWMTETSLEKAFADGQVRIVQATPDRTRTGTGEHAEYYLADEHMVMNGGQPVLVDSVKGATKGRQLTWFARSDRLLVEGAEPQPAVTTLRKK